MTVPDNFDRAEADPGLASWTREPDVKIERYDPDAPRVLEGTYTGFFTTTQAGSRVHTVEHTGPKPYTNTIVSAGAWLAGELEKIQYGRKVRITVEVVE